MIDYEQQTVIETVAALLYGGRGRRAGYVGLGSDPCGETRKGAMSETRRTRVSPAVWVPTLYFAEGLPYYDVSMVALIFYQRMGIRNQIITLTVSLLALPWSLKPLWGPLLEMYKTKKFFVVLMEFVCGLGLGMLALSLPLPGYFRYSVAFLALIAFGSSTHDIAADGLYIASLSAKKQAAYAGWQGGFYNVARFFSQGGLLILAGYLESRMPAVRAWMVIFATVGITLVMLSLFHSRVLPTGGEERHSKSLREMLATFWDVVLSFFKKPNIYFLLLFVFLYRAGEGQVVKIGPLFLKAARDQGGARPEYDAVWDDLRHVRHRGVHFGKHTSTTVVHKCATLNPLCGVILRHE